MLKIGVVTGRRTWLPTAALAAVVGCADVAPGAEDDENGDRETEEVRTAIGIGGPVRVRFVEPLDGAEVGSDVRVVLDTENLMLTEAGVFEEGTGHHHIFVDLDVTPVGQVILAGIPQVIHKGDGSAEHLIEGLEPGPHRLIAVAGDGAHIPIDPAVTDTVFITVVEGAAEQR